MDLVSQSLENLWVIFGRFLATRSFWNWGGTSTVCM